MRKVLISFNGRACGNIPFLDMMSAASLKDPIHRRKLREPDSTHRRMFGGFHWLKTPSPTVLVAPVYWQVCWQDL